MVINPIVGVYIPHYKDSLLKVGMTIPNIRSLDPGTYLTFVLHYISPTYFTLHIWIICGLYTLINVDASWWIYTSKFTYLLHVTWYYSSIMRLMDLPTECYVWTCSPTESKKESMHQRWIYISNLWRQSTLTCMKSHCGIEKCLSLSKPMVKASRLSIYQKLANSKLSMSPEFAARKVWAWFHGYIPQLSTLASKALLICRSTEIIRFIPRVRSRDFDFSGIGQIRHTWPHLQEETLVLLKISTPIMLPDCYWATNCSEHISASRLVQSVTGFVYEDV